MAEALGTISFRENSIILKYYEGYSLKFVDDSSSKNKNFSEYILFEDRKYYLVED